MNEREELTEAVERNVGAKATFRAEHYVSESFRGETVWEGPVSEYELEDHPEASICYAWKGVNEETGNPKFYAVLAVPPVDAPHKAVRAAIARDFKGL